MSRRAEATQALRRRIVDATIELHSEQGIVGTSWRDIAERADVAVATVYNHFPSLDELVPACGEQLMARLHPPSPADAADVIGDAATVEDRFGRVGVELYSFYERGGAHLDVFPGERELPAMQEWESDQRATVEAFVRAALQGHRPSASTVRLICAFYDLTTYRSLQARGFDAKAAASSVAHVVALLVKAAGRPTKRRR